MLITGTGAAAELGSKENPVRSFMPYGEREYLMRLRCPDGVVPEFDRVGSVGRGPYGNILDAYEISCLASGTGTAVFMDMYHPDYREMRPIPGFTLEEFPARAAQGCPPEVPGYELGEYVFRWFEVERPARATADLRIKPQIGQPGTAEAEFLIDANGNVDAESIAFLDISDDSLEQSAKEYIASLKFFAAEHHPGCPVPFSGKLRVVFE